ncbi:hypothetical protein GX48_03586 [Paracoccidioides brasiliensis]|nr:hypothetical protein GX48_03586 [Paracoccidioides brasiliensis]
MTQQTWARELGDRATVDAVNPGPVIGDIFRESGKDFRNRMQGWRDNAPGSMIIVDEGFDGDGRPTFPDGVAGVVGMLSERGMGSGVLGVCLLAMLLLKLSIRALNEISERGGGGAVSPKMIYNSLGW